MNIKFVKEIDSWFAISEKALWQGKICDELLFAEISPIGPNTYRINWEDTYNKPEFKNSLEEAKESVLRNCLKHTPHINGSTYSIEE